MANTVTNTRINCGLQRVTQYITVTYVDSQETDLLVYDSSAVAALLNQADPQSCKIRKIRCSSNSVAGLAKLEFDASTDVLAWTLPLSTDTDMCFEDIGGLPNYAGTGKTGDITLTTTGLAAGESFTLILDVTPR